jgi:hypothetical protein
VTISRDISTVGFNTLGGADPDVVVISRGGWDNCEEEERIELGSAWPMDGSPKYVECRYRDV